MILNSSINELVYLVNPIFTLVSMVILAIIIIMYFKIKKDKQHLASDLLNVSIKFKTLDGKEINQPLVDLSIKNFNQNDENSHKIDELGNKLANIRITDELKPIKDDIAKLYKNIDALNSNLVEYQNKPIEIDAVSHQELTEILKDVTMNFSQLENNQNNIIAKQSQLLTDVDKIKNVLRAKQQTNKAIKNQEKEYLDNEFSE